MKGWTGLGISISIRFTGKEAQGACKAQPDLYKNYSLLIITT